MIEKISMKRQKDISIYRDDKSLKLSVKSFSTTNLAEYYFRGLKLLPKSHSLDYSHVQRLVMDLKTGEALTSECNNEQPHFQAKNVKVSAVILCFLNAISYIGNFSFLLETEAFVIILFVYEGTFYVHKFCPC